ncbi:Pimeloyl-ACP methyl ester carboxylesterase [Parasphingorhabdus marina DSM 22363]|uniref:Pimeloyl-ACP methyl ester carboxylesterase n=1 Tax=Parasphingorhabdus marina DSM 22363 TaxID=1123272 RepID=A0A1N6CMK9_9SPHN|nr:alpha/beta hydrolase [Parasphingorhabdus marina]SIN59737.1 Pimeloyl-ACP methyl ester carboxylesterase [Parasphingorhabdus marina DSM 22363]
MNQWASSIAWAVTFLAGALIVSPADASEAVPESGSDIRITRDFVPGPFGQVHVRIAEPTHPGANPPLVLFHPTPYSGDYFDTFMKVMATDRTVIAIDTPGYGDSDRPEQLPSIGDYARSAAAALDALAIGTDADQKIDVLGYHTGGLIAAELAVIRPQLVRRLALPGLPFFVGEERKAAYDRNARPEPVEADGSHLLSRWKFTTAATDVGLSQTRGQAHFNDSMQCYPHCWEAYHAVFTWPSERRLAKITQPVLLITSAGSLKEETEAAREYLDDSRLIHFPEITLGGFDLHTDKLAAAVRSFLAE